MIEVDMDNFTPLESTLGGVLIGIAAVTLLVTLGRIAGISGALGGIFTFPPKKDHLWRLSFIIALLAGGVIMQFALDYSIDPTEMGMQDWWSVAGAALLVGTGTRMGNGCTSGHGVCGLSRLSFRSIVGTLTFMTTGVAAAWILPWMTSWIHFVIAVVITLGLFVLKGVLKYIDVRSQKVTKQKSLTENKSSAEFSLSVDEEKGPSQEQETAESSLPQDTPWFRKVPLIDMAFAALSGLIFGLGLSLSGMTKPSKVISFLRFGSNSWDPSLALVMGAAVVVGVVCFTFILPPKYLNPILSSILTERSYHEKLPLFNSQQWYVPGPNGQVDWQLMMGAAVFGLGWGMGGMCPGPAIITGMYTAKGIAFSGIMVATMTAFNFLK